MAYGGPGIMPGGLSADSYIERHLRPLDADHYSAAGLLPYRKGSNGSLEFLLPLERPWNSFTNAYDPLAWNMFGGKRIPRQERASETTAVRTFIDCVGQATGAPAADVMYRLMANSFAIWYALGKFGIHLVEVSDSDITADFPDQYLAWKKGAGSEEFSMTPQGFKKWNKQVDAVEWVPASELIGKPQKEVSDLLSNVLQINGFQDFLEGKLDPATLPSHPGAGQNRSKGKGSNGSKGGKGKSYKGKGDGKGKDWKGGGKGMPMYGGKGFPMMGPMGPPMGPMGAPMGAPMAPMVMPAFDQQSMEMQRQMYGEQLFLMVQPMAPNAFVAQKITGMLLELPHNELHMNLTNPEELRKRVQEALEVLEEDGITAN